MSIQILNSTLQIEADAIATLALAALLLLLGAAVKNRVRILNHYCIPAPVVGGFLFMFLTFLGHVTGSFQVSFDTYFQSPFMLAFFTTVGLSASFSLLKRGGVMLVVYWLISGVISVIQNVIGIAVGTAIGLPAPYALLSSAISMIGGHGAAASYGAQFTEMGYDQAMLVGAAAATFGLITAVMIGGPLGSQLIVRHKLTPDKADSFQGSDVFEVNKSSGEARSARVIMENVTVLLVCMAVGAKVSALIGAAIGMSFPTYVGAMFVAVLVRNLNEKLRFFSFDYALTDGIGEVMLSLYLSMALMSLKLWELAGLIGGVLLVVCCQVIFMIFAAYFIVFRLLGSNYDAAVMCAGLCGHGLGATPSAIVNMTAVTEKYGMSHRAFMIVPIVGAFLVDIIYQPQTIAFIRFFVQNIAAK